MYMLMNIYVTIYYESVQLLYTTVSNGTVLIWTYNVFNIGIHM